MIAGPSKSHSASAPSVRVALCPTISPGITTVTAHISSIRSSVTARDRQKNHKQWFLGKSLDTFCPMGPMIATADEVDPENLEVRTWVNGQPAADVRQTRTSTGSIGLQRHGTPQYRDKVIEFRRIEIADLGAVSPKR